MVEEIEGACQSRFAKGRESMKVEAEDFDDGDEVVGELSSGVFVLLAASDNRPTGEEMNMLRFRWSRCTPRLFTAIGL